MLLKSKYTIFLIAGLVFSFLFQACSKQEAPVVEQGYSENIDRKRLDACTRMNLFDDLLAHANTVDLFDCTNWNKQFPLMREQIGSFSSARWNDLLLPVSRFALNNRDTLKQAIAVTQELDQKNGLDDLGHVLTSLHDTNFYDGMNELFKCADGEQCSREGAVSKQTIVDAFGILEIFRQDSDKIHTIFANAVGALEVLSESFRQEIFKVLTAPDYVKKRVALVDLLVEFLTMERGEFERRLLPLITSVEESENLFTWVNSAAFSPELFDNVSRFLKEHPKLVHDIRSLGQIRRAGLSCNAFTKQTSIFFNLDEYLYTLANKLATLNEKALDSYLVEDLLLHNAIVQACPNLKDLKVTIDAQEHSLDIIRLKHSLSQLLQIPGVKPLSKILAGKIIEAAKNDKKALGDFLEQQTEKDYLGATIELYNIIEATSPDLFAEFVTFTKAISVDSYRSAQSLMHKLVAKELDPVWPSWNRIWHFFSVEEKNFLFNYFDRHFENDTNYLALMQFYLEIFTVFKPNLPELVAAWRDEGQDIKNFDGLKELALRFHGKEILQEFKGFFSRSHILKAIELFINGEKLTAWAADVRAALPSIALNQSSFPFQTGTTSNAYECLNKVALSDLDVLLKSFPTSCEPFEGEVLTQRLVRLQKLNADLMEQGLSSPFTSESLLSPPLLQDLIVLSKKTWDSIEASDATGSDIIKWLQDNLFGEDSRKIVSEMDSLLSFFPKKEQELFKEKLLLEIASFLKDEETLGLTTQALKDLSKWRSQGAWREIENRRYEEEILANSCAQKFNQHVGGNVCPTRDQFTSFVRRIVDLMTRKNDSQSPIAIRQFLKAMDPASGIFIPYQGQSGVKKHLGVAESLRMFWDLTNPELAVNQQSIPYAVKNSTVKEEKVTTLERVEIVIRDVNFDENYLGAHYKNSVAKSYDYLKVVNSKYDLFKFCVKAGFCGKFMNRDEKRMAKNAVAAFPSLIDVNENGLQYGDYMKALLTTVVSSSSKSSQVSTMVRFKRDRDGFNIPWLQSKKQLRKHNGVILSELAQVGAFTNMARWFLDRFARTPAEYKNYISSPHLKLIDENLFRGFEAQVSDETLSLLLNSLSSGPGIVLIHDLWNWISDMSYQDLRRVEDVVGDILLITSGIIKENPNRDWDSLLSFAAWGVKNYTLIKKFWGNTEVLTLIKNAQPWTGYMAEQMIKEHSLWRKLASRLYDHFEHIMFNEDDRVSLMQIIAKNFSARQAQSVGSIAEHAAKLLASSREGNDRVAGAAINALAAVFAPPANKYHGVIDYLTRSANKRACRYEGELVVCAQNKHYLEAFTLVSFLASEEKRWKIYVHEFFDQPDSLAQWMSDSLGLLRPITPLGN